MIGLYPEECELLDELTHSLMIHSVVMFYIDKILEASSLNELHEPPPNDNQITRRENAIKILQRFMLRKDCPISSESAMGITEVAMQAGIDNDETLLYPFRHLLSKARDA